MCVNIQYMSFPFWLALLCTTGSSFIHLIRTDTNGFLLLLFLCSDILGALFSSKSTLLVVVSEFHLPNETTSPFCLGWWEKGFLFPFLILGHMFFPELITTSRAWDCLRLIRADACTEERISTPLKLTEKFLFKRRIRCGW